MLNESYVSRNCQSSSLIKCRRGIGYIIALFSKSHISLIAEITEPPSHINDAHVNREHC
jgi:hypothetical protein